MNVKIAHKEVRYRITDEELAVLQAGDPLRETLRIGKEELSFAIAPVPDDGDVSISFEDGAIRLFVPHAKVNTLAAMGRSREGLELENDGVAIALQVDFRTQKRQPG